MDLPGARRPGEAARARSGIRALKSSQDALARAGEADVVELEQHAAIIGPMAAGPMPRQLEPMLATLGEAASARATTGRYELKWDGVRALVFADAAGGLRVSARAAATTPATALSRARATRRRALADAS